MTTTVMQPPPDTTEEAARSAPPATVSAIAVGVLAVGTAAIVAIDGSPIWRAVRVLLVLAVTVAALHVVRHGRDPARRLLSFGAGLVGLAIGIGIGGPHVAKQGSLVLTVSGLGCLGAGLVLFVVGAGGLIRGTRGWRRVPMALVLLVATYVVLWPLSVALAATNVPATTVGSATPAARGLAFREVTFSTSDGVTLSGWYLSSENGAAVVLLHGAGSTRSNVLDQAEVLADNGYGVLLYDARGHGRSGGRAMDFGWYGDQDVAAGVEFLARRGEVDPGRIGAVGLSMGGEEVLGAAAAEHRIAAVVAEGATSRSAADKAWLSEEYGFRGLVQEGIDWLQYQATDLFTAADQPIGLRAAIAASDVPVLLIAAGEVPDEPAAASHLRRGAPDRVEVWVADGAGHTGALDAHPQQWEERVIGFLDETLGSTTADANADADADE